MKLDDFIYLNLPSLLKSAQQIIPPDQKAIKNAVNSRKTLAKTEIEFLRKEGLIRIEAVASSSPIEQTILRFSEFTEEGQDFIMSQATVKWHEACERKSNALLFKGASDEARLAVYADPKGLAKRLEKFRKQRAEKAH